MKDTWCYDMLKDVWHNPESDTLITSEHMPWELIPEGGISNIKHARFTGTVNFVAPNRLKEGEVADAQG